MSLGTPFETLTIFHPSIPKVIAPEAGNPTSEEMGSPSLKMQWEMKRERKMPRK